MIEKIKDLGDYNASEKDNAVLADDIRILVAWVSNKIEWDEW